MTIGNMIVGLKKVAHAAGIKVPNLYIGIVIRRVNGDLAPLVVAHGVEHVDVFTKTFDEAGNTGKYHVFGLNDSLEEGVDFAIALCKSLEVPLSPAVPNMPCMVAMWEKVSELEHVHLIEHVYKPLMEKSK